MKESEQEIFIQGVLFLEKLYVSLVNIIFHITDDTLINVNFISNF